jgi:hypothetical protein
LCAIKYQWSNQLKNETPTYLVLAAAAAAYAAGLNTNQGKKFAQENTWTSVVIGTGLVLAALRLILPNEYWQKVALAFAVAGMPMVLRSFLNKSIREDRANQKTL